MSSTVSAPPVRLLPEERRAVLALAGIYATRMLGLFSLLPVMALYASGLPGVTPLEVGLAVGAYGLTQAILQIPLGHWSDRIGRHPVIALGLLLFLAGSLLPPCRTRSGGSSRHGRYRGRVPFPARSRPCWPT